MSYHNSPGYTSPHKPVNLPPHLLPQSFFEDFDSSVDGADPWPNGTTQTNTTQTNTTAPSAPAPPGAPPVPQPYHQSRHDSDSSFTPYPTGASRQPPYPRSRQPSAQQVPQPYPGPGYPVATPTTPTLDPGRSQSMSSQSADSGRLNSLASTHSSYQLQFNRPPYPVGAGQAPASSSAHSSPRRAPPPPRQGPPPTRPYGGADHQRRIASSPQMPTFPGQTALPPPQPQMPASNPRTRSLNSASWRPRMAPAPPLPQQQQQQQHQQYNQPYSPTTTYPAQNSQANYAASAAAAASNQAQAPPPRQASHSSSRSKDGHTFSLSSKSRSFTSISKLSSLSTKKASATSLPSTTSLAALSSSSTVAPPSPRQQSRRPPVYPAMLSAVARQFREAIILTVNTKDGLEYHDTFTGKMAVDIICRLIRTNDRNLALLLGRSLDAQKLFHDVTYQHRLRDSVHEVYAFNRTYTDDPSAPPQSDSSNGVFTILTECYSPTCTRNALCYSIACPRRLEQQARLNMKPAGGLRRAVSRLSLGETEENKTLWHETVPQSVLDSLSKQEKMRQELIYEFIYTERDYVKDLEFMTDFYIMPLRNPANNIIPEHQRETFIHTVFGGVGDLLRLAKQFSEALTRRQQQQKPVISTIADVFLEYVQLFDPFVRYSGNKVFASFEHERQQQVNPKYARFLDAIEKKPESRKQDLSSFLIKGVQRPARYQLLLQGIIKNTDESSPDYKNLTRAKDEIEKLLSKINTQTGESTDRHKIMVLHRLLGKQTLEKKNFKLSYHHRIIYQASLHRKRDNERIDLYLFEHALLLVKHKIHNKREHHKVYEKPMYLGLVFVNSGIDAPSTRSILAHRVDESVVSDPSIRNRIETSNFGTGGGQTKYQINFLGLGANQVHVSLFAEDVTIQSQILQQIYQQQKKLIEQHDFFTLSKYETRKFYGSNKINCAVPFHGGKKLLYGTDSGLWLSTVRQISATSTEKIVSDPTIVISRNYVTQIEVLVEYGKLLVLADKQLFEYDLSCCDSLDHARNTRSGKLLASPLSFFKTGICDGKLLVCGAKVGPSHSIIIFEPTNPFDRSKNKSRRTEIREVSFSSDPVSISFLKTKLCIGCTKGFEILSLKDGQKEPILDEADPSLDFAILRDQVTPLAIHRLNKEFMLCYSEFVFLINRNGWRINHDWFIAWEGTPQNMALFFPYLLAFEPGFVEIRDLHSTTLLRSLVGENIRFLYSNEHEAMYACEENGYDIIVSIDFLK
ncbi:RHO1 GDP-GTP exchange protein 2 [Diutina rugosa]